MKHSIFTIIAVLSIAATSSAEAQNRQRQDRTATVVCNERGCSDQRGAARPQSLRRSAAAEQVDPNGNTIIVGSRPAGCPRQYCGCEASRYLFGEIRPELNLAANWIRKFPRTAPGAGMVAARNGHVMVLISHAGGNEWLVHDGNSGGGLTRRHVRSIGGYVVVDPNGSRTASN